MVAVIANVEGDDLLLFLLLIVLHEGEDQAAVGGIVIGLDVLHATVDERLLLYLTACSHREMDLITHLVILCMVRACLSQDAEHIEDTAVIAVLHLLRFALRIDPRAALTHFRDSILVAEPSLIHGISFTLLGRLAEVERFKQIGGKAGQGVAHLEEEVALLAAHAGQAVAESLLPLILRSVGGKTRYTHLFPDEFPIEIEVIHHLLTTLKSLIDGLTLRPSPLRQRHSTAKENRENYLTYHSPRITNH